ncbi:MAG: selenide, water dikinase SelD [Coriobacteriia bacterium]|nr:selenide, water dikinase SelD [Coriobacteriia bacterium]
MLDKIDPGQSDNLMLGFETSDDAAVYKLTDDIAGLMTIDFFTPIVDDPYDFGRITAANALSDIYAMGGKPLTALNMIAFPCSLGPDIVGEVVRGGAEKVAEAGAVVVGGHTIDDKEPKYGLSVFGVVNPLKVLRNKGAREADAIVVTKALGTGLWGTAIKRGVADETTAHEAIESMAKLNKYACEALEGVDVHALTDITGFGLAGHLHEMAEASGVAAHIETECIPLLEQVYELSTGNVVPGRTADIIAWTREFLSWSAESYSQEERRTWMQILCDPQTSGGLMIAMPQNQVETYYDNLIRIDSDAICAVVGTFEHGTPGKITIN